MNQEAVLVVEWDELVGLKDFFVRTRSIDQFDAQFSAFTPPPPPTPPEDLCYSESGQPYECAQSLPPLGGIQAQTGSLGGGFTARHSRDSGVTIQERVVSPDISHSAFYASSIGSGMFGGGISIMSGGGSFSCREISQALHDAMPGYRTARIEYFGVLNAMGGRATLLGGGVVKTLVDQPFGMPNFKAIRDWLAPKLTTAGIYVAAYGFAYANWKAAQTKVHILAGLYNANYCWDPYNWDSGGSSGGGGGGDDGNPGGGGGGSQRELIVICNVTAVHDSEGRLLYESYWGCYVSEA
ncbi:MAG TPA: hypothetical protein VKZ41_09785 [Gemmatimonadales bacterium]|nr:hypothetical protein [Gemmatimonadales bacterium]